MTHSEVERISALETSLGLLRADVLEIKSDVKFLRLAESRGLGALAVLSRGIPWLAGLLSVLAMIRSG